MTRSMRVYPRPCGGNPCQPARQNRARERRVYPRPCGGNAAGAARGKPEEGLSPPVRGKPGLVTQADHRGRSIPARAGETLAGGVVVCPCGVYPRPCGGNEIGSMDRPAGKGLSPPVRGKPGELVAVERCRGSIPARAGETTERSDQTRRPWVYPRPCGGNFLAKGCRQHQVGLSPPVRGKRFRFAGLD